MKIPRWVICLGAIITTILIGSFTHAQNKPVVMVADFELVDVPQQLKASLSGQLQAAVAATGKYRTTDPTVTRKALSEQSRQQKMADCYAEECLAKVGKALGASEMIVGTITKVKENFYTVNLKLVDISLLTSVNTVSEPCHGDIEATYGAIDRAVARLLGVDVTAPPSPPRQEFGALSVNTGVGGTQVYLDGQLQGTISQDGQPLQIQNVITGKHTVGVEHPDYQAKEQEAWVRPNVTEEIRIDLEGKPGKIIIASTPPKARVSIGGEEKGETPYTALLSPGEYRVQVALSGFSPQEKDIEIKPNRVLRLNVPLEALPGMEEQPPEVRRGIEREIKEKPRAEIKKAIGIYIYPLVSLYLSDIKGTNYGGGIGYRIIKYIGVGTQYAGGELEKDTVKGSASFLEVYSTLHLAIVKDFGVYLKPSVNYQRVSGNGIEKSGFGARGEGGVYVFFKPIGLLTGYFMSRDASGLSLSIGGYF